MLITSPNLEQKDTWLWASSRAAFPEWSFYDLCMSKEGPATSDRFL